MNLKEELLKTYVNRIADFQRIHELCPDDKSGPLLMSLNEKYAQQPNPFLAIGQETNGWDIPNYPFSEEECFAMIKVYEKFNLGEEYYSTPFWNVIRKIEEALSNEPYSCAWTNISKYDQNEKTPDEEHEKIFSLVDNLLIDEIKISNPKICIFFTSHHFDYRIENMFDTIEFLPVNEFEPHVLCQLKHEQLPVLTFRTYHPKYLRMSGIEDRFIEFISKLK